MDSSALRNALQKLKDSGQLRANPIIIATVHATRRDSKMGLITIQTSGSFQSPTKTFRADHHGHADAVSASGTALRSAVPIGGPQGLMPARDRARDPSSRCTNCPGRDSQRPASRSLCGCCGYVRSRLSKILAAVAAGDPHPPQSCSATTRQLDRRSVGESRDQCETPALGLDGSTRCREQQITALF